MAIASLLSLSLCLTLHLLDLVAGRTRAGESSERGGEDVVGDRFERDVVAVVDEPDARDPPPPANIGRE
jgi:hypothetical protein